MYNQNVHHITSVLLLHQKTGIPYMAQGHGREWTRG